MVMDSERIAYLRALAEICGDEAVDQRDFDAICDEFPKLLAEYEHLQQQVDK